MQPEEVINTVGEYYGVEQKALFTKSRCPGLLSARYLTMYFLKTHCLLTQNEIGAIFGKLSRTTIIKAINIVNRRGKDTILDQDFNNLEKLIVNYEKEVLQLRLKVKTLKKQVKRLRNILKNASSMTKEKVLQIVCNYFGITVEEMATRSRKRSHVMPRHICFYFMNNYTVATLKEIGDIMGGYDHTTVMLAVKKVTELIEVEDNWYFKHCILLQKIFGKPLDNVNLKNENRRLKEELQFWQRRAKAKKTILKQLTPDVKEVKFERPPAVYSNQRAS